MPEPQEINDILDDVMGAGDPVDNGTVEGLDAAKVLAAEGDKDLPEEHNPYTFHVEIVEEREGDYGAYYMIKLRVTGSATGKYIGMGTTLFMNKVLRKDKTAIPRARELVDLRELFLTQTGVDIWLGSNPDPTGLADKSFQADIGYFMRTGKRPIVKIKEARI